MYAGDVVVLAVRAMVSRGCKAFSTHEKARWINVRGVASTWLTCRIDLEICVVRAHSLISCRRGRPERRDQGGYSVLFVIGKKDHVPRPKEEWGAALVALPLVKLPLYLWSQEEL